MKTILKIPLFLCLIIIYGCPRITQLTTKDKLIPIENGVDYNLGLKAFQFENNVSLNSYLEKLRRQFGEEKNTDKLEQEYLAFERKLNHNSLRKIIDNRENQFFNNDSWTEENDPDDFFIQDDILRLILNKNGEFIIEDKIVIFVAECHLVLLDKNNIPKLNKLRRVSDLFSQRNLDDFKVINYCEDEVPTSKSSKQSIELNEMLFSGCPCDGNSSTKKFHNYSSDRKFKAVFVQRNIGIRGLFGIRYIVVKTKNYKKKTNGKWEKENAELIKAEFGGVIYQAGEDSEKCATPLAVVWANTKNNDNKAKHSEYYQAKFWTKSGSIESYHYAKDNNADGWVKLCLTTDCGECPEYFSKPCDLALGGFIDAKDKLFIANVNGGGDDLVFVNTGGSGTAIRVVDLATMNDISSMNYGTLGQGFTDNGDRMFIANVNGGGDDLVFVNTGGSGTAIRVVDLATMNDISSMNYGTLGQGFTDNGDRMFIANVNGGGDDLVFVNTGGSGTAIRVVDLATMNDISSMNYGTLGQGFTDNGDRMFIANVNGGGDDLVFVNTGGSGTAIRVVDLATMNDISSMNYGTLGQGFTDNGDRMFIANVNGGGDDLVFVNTGGSGTAIRVVDLATMNDISSMNYGTLGQGFTDNGDRMFIANVNGGGDDLVFVNTGGSGTAIRVVDLATMNDISSMNYGTLGQGFTDNGDRMFIANVNGGGDDLVFVNTGGSGTAIRVVDLATMNDISIMDHCE